MSFLQNNKPTIITIFVTMALLIVFLLVSNQDPAPLAGEVADRLAANEATLYLVSGQVDSETQRGYFGPYINRFAVVDCVSQVDLCVSEKIEEAPTFVFPNLGIEFVGTQTPAELKKLLSELKIW